MFMTIDNVFVEKAYDSFVINDKRLHSHCGYNVIAEKTVGYTRVYVFTNGEDRGFVFNTELSANTFANSVKYNRGIYKNTWKLIDSYV